MFKGKPLLPKILLNYEFETYVVLLFFSRFFPILFSPLIKYSVITYFTTWLNEIYQIQHTKGMLYVWTTYPFLFNFYFYFLNSISSGNLFLFSILFYFINAISDCITGIILWKIMEISNQYYSQYARWLYLYSPLPLFWIFTQQIYDPIVILFLTSSVYFIQKNKKIGTILVSIGTSLKLTPALIFASCFFDRTKRIFFIRNLPFFIFLLLLINIPFFVNPSLYLDFVYWQSNRPAWESIFGFLEYMYNGFYFPSGIYLNCPSDKFTLALVGYHMIGITPCPSIFGQELALDFLNYKFNVFKIISLLLIAFFSLLLLLKAYNKQSYNRITLGIISSIFAFSFGFSPQYALYELVMIILALNSNKIVFYSSILQVLLFLEYPFISIFIPVFFNFSVQEILIPFWIVIFARTAFFIYITIGVMLNKI